MHSALVGRSSSTVTGVGARPWSLLTVVSQKWLILSETGQSSLLTTQTQVRMHLQSVCAGDPVKCSVCVPKTSGSRFSER